jgi:hypothetical protein
MTGGLRLARAVAALVVCGLLAGCSLPHRKDDLSATKVAASTAQVEEVYDRYLKIRGNALHLLDARPLTSIESGPVLAIDSGALEVARRLLLTEKPDDRQSLRILDVLAPRLDSYPLWFVVLAADETRDVTKVQIFERESAVAQWEMVASPEVLSSTTLPELQTDGSGALVGAAPDSDEGLAVSPAAALDAYAAALDDPTSPDAGEVAEDSFIRSMRDVADRQSAIEGVRFSQEWSARPVEYALRTVDGGALVFATLQRVDRYRIDAGRAIDWPEGSEQEAFLSGRLYSTGVLRYFHQVLMYVPPESDEKPFVLGQYGGVVEGVGY